MRLPRERMLGKEILRTKQWKTSLLKGQMRDSQRRWDFWSHKLGIECFKQDRVDNSPSGGNIKERMQRTNHI